MWAPTSEDHQFTSRETRYFLDWMDACVLTDANMRRAEDALLTAESECALIRRYRTTPQGAPHHAEGIVVADHVKRILCGIYAVLDGVNLLDIEEFAREKVLKNEILALEQTIRENAGTVITFALVHDIAKANTLSFESPSGSRGYMEGFFQHKHRNQSIASEAERMHYLKLFRSFQETCFFPNAEQVVAAFYDTYEIKTHYYDHALIGADEEFESVRFTIGSSYHLSGDDFALLQLLMKEHIRVLQMFSKGVNVAAYRSLVERFNRAGFDADDALDLLFACVFVDSAFGSLAYRDGQFYAQLDTVLNVFRTEDLLRAGRRTRREEKRASNDRRRLKSALQASGLLGEDLFTLLDIPFGEERGRVMSEVRAAVISGSDVDFGDRTDEVKRRIDQARAFLTRDA